MNNVHYSTNRNPALKACLLKHNTMPNLSVVGCADHQKVADEIAELSITIVRGQASLLALHLQLGRRVVVVIPKPQDLTLADTSSYIVPALASSHRAYYPNVDEFIILGASNAYNQIGQQAITHEVLKMNISTFVVALPLPCDSTPVLESPTYLYTYSILESAMQVLVKVLFGIIPFQGRLLISIHGLYNIGHSLEK